MKLILPDNKEQEISITGRTVESILTEMGIRTIEVLVSRDGTIIPEDTILSDSDTIQVIRIVHGG